MRTGLVVLILIVVVLALFNPSMAAFKEFAGVQMERVIGQEVGAGRLGEALSGIGGALTSAYVDRITTRQNYVVFSTYTLDVDGPEATADDWRFLGIAGRFIELHRPETIRERSENP